VGENRASIDELTVRPMAPADRPWMVRALVGLQEWERQYFDGLLAGTAWVEPYLDDLVRRAASANGEVSLACLGGAPVGFAAWRVEEDGSLEETPDSRRYGYVSDLFVEERWRGRRLAARLIGHAEERLRESGVTRLRIAVLAGNVSAIRAYEAAGFRPYLMRLEKMVGGSS